MKYIKDLKIKEVNWIKYAIYILGFIVYSLVIYAIGTQHQDEKMKQCKELINGFDRMNSYKNELGYYDKMISETSQKFSEESNKVEQLILNLKNR